ncbi:MAG: PQQ-dependent sugar dehydrogenase, partial [Verrucomicrobiota bacterium]|nr:PQQ-dependent sugar dehydrogenase [Verrucomicrobiota bacterium]
GDVGQHGREEINLVVKGGNYGWGYFEGALNGPKKNPPSGVLFRQPIQQYGTGYATNQGFAVIGGAVYRGDSFPELREAYIYADYVTGNIWATFPTRTGFTPARWLTANAGIAGFGIDPASGELLMADHEEGLILKLVSGGVNPGNLLPAKLSETGIFANLSQLTPNSGIIPFEVNLPFWSDHAIKSRWFSVPHIHDKLGFSETNHWNFPAGTVWVKHFDLEMRRGDPSSKKRLETRVIVRNQQGIYGVTYKWNQEQTDAFLVAEEGADETYSIQEGSTSRSQTWRYPSRNECLTCHTAQAGYALGFNAHQLNRNITVNSTTLNQLQLLSQMGYMDKPIPNTHLLPRLARPDDQNVSIHYRVKSYLAANCAYCHQRDESNRGFWDARLSTKLSDSAIINGALRDSLGNQDNRVIKPNSLDHSILFQRISKFGPAPHMPPLGTSVIDETAVELLRQWITQGLAGYKSYDEWKNSVFSSSANRAENADPDLDGASNKMEYLLKTDPENPSSVWKFNISRDGAQARISMLEMAHLAYDIQTTTDLLNPDWKSLNVPGNEPFFPATNRNRVFDYPLGESNQFFRVRILEP